MNTQVGYFHAIIDGVDFVFIDHACFHHVKESIYAGELPDQSFRFQLLCRAALEAVWHIKCGPDPLTATNYGDNNTVFIANDWQTSLLPVYLQAYYRDHGKMLGSRSIIVLHNCAFQVREGGALRGSNKSEGVSTRGESGYVFTGWLEIPLIRLMGRTRHSPCSRIAGARPVQVGGGFEPAGALPRDDAAGRPVWRRVHEHVQGGADERAPVGSVLSLTLT